MSITSSQRVLVVANITAMSDQLLATLQERSKRCPTSFTVILPATQHGGGSAGATERLEAALERMRSAGLTVEGQVGDRDPVWAVREAWDPRRYDEIILCTLPMRVSKWLHAGLPQRIAELTGACVTHVVAEPPKPPVHVDHLVSPDQTISGPLAPLHALEAVWRSPSRPSERVP
jgi:GABA permease